MEHYLPKRDRVVYRVTPFIEKHQYQVKYLLVINDSFNILLSDTCIGSCSELFVFAFFRVEKKIVYWNPFGNAVTESPRAICDRYCFEISHSKLCSFLFWNVYVVLRSFLSDFMHLLFIIAWSNIILCVVIEKNYKKIEASHNEWK